MDDEESPACGSAEFHASHAARPRPRTRRARGATARTRLGVRAPEPREVRVAIAKGLAAVGAEPATVRDALARLVDDADALVRAAAYTALGTTRCPAPLAGRAEAALADPAWQVRAGAATALSVADSAVAVPALAEAVTDPNADVRKAAVLALTRHGSAPRTPGRP